MIEIIEQRNDAITEFNIGERLLELRKEQRYSRLELAEEAGISVGAVWSVEQGNNPTLRVICNALDVLGYELVLRRKYE